MTKCWAHHLGNCGKQSKEHVISGALFADTSLEVRGLRPAGGGLIHVGKASLTANILCTTHNSLLSPLDSEAAALSRAIARMQEGESTTHSIKGPLLERWLLKTLINLLAAKWLGRWYVPAPDLVDIVFGRISFPGNSGLYVSHNTRVNSPKMDRFSVNPLLFGKEPAIVGGALMSIGFIDFLLCINSDGIRTLFEAAGEEGISGIEPANLIWRPRQVVLGMESAQGSVGELKMALDW
jgi:hypothetical protein